MQLRFWQVALIAITAATADTLSMADGLSDVSFGQSGVAKIAFPNSTDGGVQAAALVNGHLVVAGFAPQPNNLIAALNAPPPLYIAQVSLAGVPSGAAIINQRAIQNPIGLVVRADGNIFAAGVNFDPNGMGHATVVWFDSTGQMVSTYQRPVSGPNDQSSCLSQNRKLLLDSRGNLLAACIHGSLDDNPEGPSFVLQVVRLIPQNGALNPDSTFGTNGWQDIGLPSGYVPGSGFASVFEDPGSGNYYFGATAFLTTAASFAETPYLVRLDATTGAPDSTYGNSGFAMANANGDFEASAIDGSGRVIVAGHHPHQVVPCCGQTYGDSFITRFNTDGTVDSTFGSAGFVTAQWLGPIVDALADATGRIYLQASQLSRLTVSGDRDTDFSSSSDIQAVNGAGSTWASMLFSNGAHSAVYLLGGAFAAKSATTAVIQKITLEGGAPVVATQTTLAATANQTALTLTATVAGNHPTGGVTFFDGAGVIGTASLSNGTTALSVAVAIAGTYNITAYYGGDAANGFSNSSVVPVTVAVTNTQGGTQGGTNSGGTTHVSGGGEISPFEIVALALLALVGRLPNKNRPASKF